MRTLAVTQNVTVDGRVEMLDDWFSGTGQADDPELLALMHRHLAANDAVVLGRRTFTDMRGYWPTLVDDPTGVSAHLDRVAKYVVSATLADPDWAGTTLLDGDPVPAVRALKEQPGADVVVTGSITLTHALIAAGLVDELRLFTYPVVQGRGRGLVPEGHVLPRLRRLEAAAFPGGVTFARYGVDEKILPGLRTGVARSPGSARASPAPRRGARTRPR